MSGRSPRKFADRSRSVPYDHYAVFIQQRQHRMPRLAHDAALVVALGMSGLFTGPMFSKPHRSRVAHCFPSFSVRLGARLAVVDALDGLEDQLVGGLGLSGGCGCEEAKLERSGNPLTGLLRSPPTL
jgi:hypothetical protein